MWVRADLRNGKQQKSAAGFYRPDALHVAKQSIKAPEEK